jgi:hypothetical protein
MASESGEIRCGAVGLMSWPDDGFMLRGLDIRGLDWWKVAEFPCLFAWLGLLDDGWRDKGAWR